jgi:Trk-type K+ transport system membrane component
MFMRDILLLFRDRKPAGVLMLLVWLTYAGAIEIISFLVGLLRRKRTTKEHEDAMQELSKALQATESALELFATSRR